MDVYERALKLHEQEEGVCMNYEDMTLQELKNVAKELGIKGVTVMKKDELIDLLNAVKGHQKETADFRNFYVSLPLPLNIR